MQKKSTTILQYRELLGTKDKIKEGIYESSANQLFKKQQYETQNLMQKNPISNNILTKKVQEETNNIIPDLTKYKIIKAIPQNQFDTDSSPDQKKVQTEDSNNQFNKQSRKFFSSQSQTNFTQQQQQGIIQRNELVIQQQGYSDQGKQEEVNFLPEPLSASNFNSINQNKYQYSKLLSQNSAQFNKKKQSTPKLGKKKKKKKKKKKQV
eukprot:TRINITY_DN15168_c0_g1_i2.p2 TRINITY_DN15168_c0_g1~~TRINITY_DN15168_c0_g1_i2.p2  ORF type:complete len:208 (-),score=53.22 TRINITY_DN15168_c0_g1_i2:73-696(-)